MKGCACTSGDYEGEVAGNSCLSDKRENINYKEIKFIFSPIAVLPL